MIGKGFHQYIKAGQKGSIGKKSGNAKADTLCDAMQGSTFIKESSKIRDNVN